MHCCELVGALEWNDNQVGNQTTHQAPERFVCAGIRRGRVNDDPPAWRQKASDFLRNVLGWNTQYGERIVRTASPRARFSVPVIGINENHIAPLQLKIARGANGQGGFPGSALSRGKRDYRHRLLYCEFSLLITLEKANQFAHFLRSQKLRGESPRTPFSDYLVSHLTR